ncbi:hypothetical protein DICSQDRAFT_169495 [Dichomitus squalens LYAD-421 SS1]|uniref:Heterokaryon incompatibility domain-containing protein n=1 Tax=Dichomitus squalens (strain LYAD-421) TaxID=732165 RepID=R7T1S9_DICSQ|nr:uncharacterized protein DICSQDRAFT_169495 [Dichomitus squalens LYAD-421 SS1]EJF61915.1 hypothetical protein DICSQDRAFT_169495 [Dichomitus squalens LYAD-421 SS1]
MIRGNSDASYPSQDSQAKPNQSHGLKPKIYTTLRKVHRVIDLMFAVAQPVVCQNTRVDGRGSDAIDNRADMENLFIYFLDIPCIDIPCIDIPYIDISHPLSESDITGFSSRPCTQMVQLIRVIIESVLDMKVPMDRLVLPHGSATVISRGNLAKLLVPWARQMLLDKTNPAYDLEYHRERGRKVTDILSRQNICHVAPGCTCALVKPSIEAVRSSYLEDDVPAVIFDGNGLTVRPASKGPYVAISHVWADGLGSSTEHGLPLCQVARLDALVRKLVPDGAFWHDGLCVPSPKTQRPTWQRAISLLARIYAGADKVLVVDGGVRTQCSLAKPVEECLLRIATSGWAQRIWTLQEGVLARELYFEVADGLVDCSHFDGDASFITSCLIPTLRYRRHDGDSKFQRRLSQRPRCSLNDLIRFMRLRSFTCPEDEPLAIAGLLGIDAAPLAEIRDGQERMKSLLLQVREVPHRMIISRS